MSSGQFVRLEERGIVTVAGPDRLEFLQGLVTNDVEKAGPGRALWAALLTPQGKYLHDFFLTDHDAVFSLDCEAGRLMDLGQRLRKYKLRADIELNIGQGLAVYALLDADPALFGLDDSPGAAAGFAGGTVYVDPRLADIGLRAVGNPEALEAAFAEMGLQAGGRLAYDDRRISLGLPDGSHDMTVEKATLLENGFSELQGVDWQKGCYMGQELTARMRYRGLVKKRLMPFRFDGALPEDTDRIEAGGREIGEIRTRSANRGLALVRLDRWRDAVTKGLALAVGTVPVIVEQPDWMQLPPENNSQ